MLSCMKVLWSSAPLSCHLKVYLGITSRVKKHKGYCVLSGATLLDFVKAMGTYVLASLGCTWDSFLHPVHWLKTTLINEIVPLGSLSSDAVTSWDKHFHCCSDFSLVPCGWLPLWPPGLGGDGGWPLAYCGHGKIIAMEGTISGVCSVNFPVAMAP